MGQTYEWEYDKKNNTIKSELIGPTNTSTIPKPQADFVFEILKLKYNTLIEELKVTAKYNGKPMGSVILHPISMEKDFMSIINYGVILNRQDYSQIIQVIKDNYYIFQTQIIDENLKDENGKKIFEMCCECLKDIVKNNKGSEEVNSDDQDYYLSATLFRELLEDSEFSELSYKSVKQWLMDNGYTHVNAGRTDCLKKINGKPTRIIKFNKDKVTDYFEKRAKR